MTFYISIITATFNADRQLPKLIESIRGQTYKNFQWIVIDGGSSDNTVKLIKEATDVVSYFISEPDKGIYDAWNKGLKQIKGEWVFFIGADDFLLCNSTLGDLSRNLERVPISIDIAYAQIKLFNQREEPLYIIGSESTNPQHEIQNLKHSIPHPGLMHRSTLFERYGYFDKSFIIAGDYEFLLRVINNHNVKFIPNLVTVGMTEGGISSNPKNSLKQLYEVRLAQKKHGLKLPSLQWLLALSRVFIRLVLWKTIGEKQTRITLDIGRKLMGKPLFWTKT